MRDYAYDLEEMARQLKMIPPLPPIVIDSGHARVSVLDWIDPHWRLSPKKRARLELNNELLNKAAFRLLGGKS